MIQKSALTIYAEATPNPSSLKFVANDFLLPEEGQALEFRTKAAAAPSPLATKLFDFPYVKSVFITANFVTITQDESREWHEIIPELKEFIKHHLISGGGVLIPGVVIEEPKPLENTSDIEKQIISILDEYIRPAVEGDGGAIELKSFDRGTVTVVLRGSCSGCPSSSLTLKAGIENLLRRMIPEVDEVIAESV